MSDRQIYLTLHDHQGVALYINCSYIAAVKANVVTGYANGACVFVQGTRQEPFLVKETAEDIMTVLTNHLDCVKMMMPGAH
ncbi:MAG: hypothetical protein SFY67_17145 [Candidatus Melainabacteria bacterium]|nr:hypothetical protein [Candidatus Melainabacteria bacterium]